MLECFPDVPVRSCLSLHLTVSLMTKKKKKLLLHHELNNNFSDVSMFFVHRMFSSGKLIFLYKPQKRNFSREMVDSISIMKFYPWFVVNNLKVPPTSKYLQDSRDKCF